MPIKSYLGLRQISFIHFWHFIPYGQTNTERLPKLRGNIADMQGLQAEINPRHWISHMIC